MDKVALLKCDEYDLKKVEKTLRNGFELLGRKLFFKLNLYLIIVKFF